MRAANAIIVQVQRRVGSAREGDKTKWIKTNAEYNGIRQRDELDPEVPRLNLRDGARYLPWKTRTG